MLEAIALCEKIAGRRLQYSYSDEARSGDHIWYISDVRKFQSDYPAWSYNYNLEEILIDIYTQWCECARAPLKLHGWETGGRHERASRVDHWGSWVCRGQPCGCVSGAFSGRQRRLPGQSQSAGKRVEPGATPTGWSAVHPRRRPLCGRYGRPRTIRSAHRLLGPAFRPCRPERIALARAAKQLAGDHPMRGSSASLGSGADLPEYEPRLSHRSDQHSPLQ